MNKQNLEDLLSDDSFLRFVRGEASETERKRWESWRERDPAHRILNDQAVQLMRFTACGEFNIPDPILEMQKIEKLANPGKSSTANHHNSFKSISSKHRKKNYWWITSAAMIMIVLSLSLVLEKVGVRETEPDDVTAIHTSSEFLTGNGEKETFQLSDGSRIILNANSHLTYAFTGDVDGTRDIDIRLDGEAWFDIRPVNTDGQTKRKIRIHTQDGIIEVLGTTFVVQTSGKGTRTVLEKGTIKIDWKGLNEDENTNSIIMEPGHMAQFLSGIERIELKKVNPEIYTSWIRDVWVFDQTPLTDVAERIESVFGVEVIIPFESIQDLKISGSIGSENLQLIMNGISEAVEVSVTRLNNRIVIGG